MNLSLIKSSAEKAKSSPLELELWRDAIEPDDVLRLVEVARAARLVLCMLDKGRPNHLLTEALLGLNKAMGA